MTAQTYNRVTATVATSIFLILSLLLANFSNQDSPDVIQRRPSTFFTDSTGARALLLVMRRLLPSVEQWRRPLYLLPSASQRSRCCPSRLDIDLPGSATISVLALPA